MSFYHTVPYYYNHWTSFHTSRANPFYIWRHIQVVLTELMVYTLYTCRSCCPFQRLWIFNFILVRGKKNTQTWHGLFCSNKLPVSMHKAEEGLYIEARVTSETFISLYTWTFMLFFEAEWGGNSRKTTQGLRSVGTRPSRSLLSHCAGEMHVCPVPPLQPDLDPGLV